MEGLAGKVIIVAGGATGIGAAAALRLGRGGALVIIGDVNEHSAEGTAAAITATGGEARHRGFDITDEASVDRLVTYAIAEFGHIDGLYNAVADLRAETFLADTNILDLDLDVWARTLQVNLTGFLLTMRRVLPELLKRGGGSIVNTSSHAAGRSPTQPAYGASKGGVNALTGHVAAAYGRAGIRCNAVVPGIIPTERAKALVEQSGSNVIDHYRQIRESYFLSDRDGKPEDVASMVAMLMSDEGSWINGQCIYVDGGLTIR